MARGCWCGHRSRCGGAAAGFVGGITGGLAGFPGAFVTIWCDWRGWDKRRQRGVYQPFILAMQSFTLAAIHLIAPAVRTGGAPPIDLATLSSRNPVLRTGRIARNLVRVGHLPPAHRRPVCHDRESVADRLRWWAVVLNGRLLAATSIAATKRTSVPGAIGKGDSPDVVHQPPGRARSALSVRTLLDRKTRIGLQAESTREISHLRGCRLRPALSVPFTFTWSQAQGEGHMVFVRLPAAAARCLSDAWRRVR